MDSENNYLNKETHEEFEKLMRSENKRLEDENIRQNHRLSELEENVKQINNLTLSIQELSSSVKSIAKETERLGVLIEKNVQELDKRVGALESMDGKKWREVVSHAITAALGIVIAFVFQKVFGM